MLKERIYLSSHKELIINLNELNINITNKDYPLIEIYIMNAINMASEINNPFDVRIYFKSFKHCLSITRMHRLASKIKNKYKNVLNKCSVYYLSRGRKFIVKLILLLTDEDTRKKIVLID